MDEISKERIAKELKEIEEAEKKLIDSYLASPREYEIEIRVIVAMAEKTGMLRAGEIIILNMWRLHTLIAKETGQVMTEDDTGPVPEF